MIDSEELEVAPKPEPRTEEEMNVRILELIMDLTTIILYGKALAELRKLKQRKPAAFRSTEFFKQVMGVMEWNHFRLGVRRVVIDLFEKHVMRQIVFDEDDETESSSEGEEDDDEEEVSPRKKPPPKKKAQDSDSSSGESSSEDDRTERQRSVSEPTEFARRSLVPPPLNLR